MYKILVYELREVLHSRILLGGVFLFLVFYVGICAATVYGGGYDAESYKYIKQYLQENFSSDDERITWIREQYEALVQSEEASQTASDTSETETALVTVLMSEAEQVAGYDSYVEQIRESADISSSISIFSAKDAFSERNIQKTDEDYASVQGTEMVFQGSAGFVKLLNLEAQSVLLYAMLVMLVMQIVLEDKRRNLDKLYSTTKNGQAVRAAAKVCTMFACSFLLVAAFFFLNIIFAITAYGGLDWTAPIQTLYGYEGSVLHLSVWQYLAVLLLERWITAFVLSVMLAVVAAVLNNSPAFMGIAVFIYACAMPLGGISEQSAFMTLKYTNFIYLLKGTGLFRDYVNLNIFSYPISQVLVNSILLLLCALLFAGIFLMCYARLPGWVRRLQYLLQARLDWILEKIRKKAIACRVWVPFRKKKKLFNFELSKMIFGKKIGTVILGVAAVLFIVSAYRTENLGLNEIYYKLYMHQYEGEISEEKIEKLEKESKRLDTCLSDMAVLSYQYKQGEMSETEYSIKYNELENSSLGNTAFRKLEQRLQYLISYSKKHQALPSLVYDEGWKLLLGLGDEGWTESMVYILIALLCVIISVSGIFSMEYETGMRTVLNSCRNGKKTLAKAKCCAGIVIAVLSGLAVYVPAIYYYRKEYGLQMLFSPAASIPELAALPYSITILDCAVGIFILRFILLAAVSLFTMYISEKTQNTVKTLCIGLAVVIIPLSCLVLF